MQTRPRLIKVDTIITRTSHYERLTLSGAGYIRNGRPAPRPGGYEAAALAGAREKAVYDSVARLLNCRADEVSWSIRWSTPAILHRDLILQSHTPVPV